MIVCRPFRKSDRTTWDHFVHTHPMGSPFHLMAWRDILRENFSYKPKYRVAVENDRIVGILPLFLVENIVTGSVLISTPFAVYGGILAASEAAHEALKGHVREMADRLDVQYLDLRNRSENQCINAEPVDRYATFTRAVGPSDQESLLAALPQKTRNLVRKALKFPFQMRAAQNLDTFYELLVRTYRRLGTPAFPRVFFQSIVRNFGGMVDIREVWLEGRAVAASLNFLFREQMHTYYAASADDAWAMGPNNYMYFEHLLWAGNHGFRVFDFGRSKKGTGPYSFKKHFGATEHPLPYEVLLVKRLDMPNFSPTNPNFDLAVKVWRKIPLPVTKILGPQLIGLFP